MHFPKSTVALIACAALAACNAQRPAEQDPVIDQPDQSATDDAQQAKTVSILRPGVEDPDGNVTDDIIGPLEVTIGFPEGGNTLNEDARSALNTVLKSDQIALGRSIVLRAHSDSAGTDSANIRASEQRGLAVKKWLTDKGIDADRITVLAFGEQNPAQPNALSDGTPNEKGRAANRRVDIMVEGGRPQSPAAEMADRSGEEKGSAQSGN